MAAILRVVSTVDRHPGLDLSDCVVTFYRLCIDSSYHSHQCSTVPKRYENIWK